MAAKGLKHENYPTTMSLIEQLVDTTQLLESNTNVITNAAHESISVPTENQNAQVAVLFTHTT